jgi:hypothetical protein
MTTTPLMSIVTRTSPGDGLHCPRWTGGNAVAGEPADGPIDEFPARRVMVGRLGPTITSELTLDDISVRVLITDGRVAMVCRRFEAKGGGWIGFGWGALFALVANGVSKARAASRGAGKAAVGHIRHEWVSFVGWKSKTMGGNADEVRIGYRPPAEPEATFVVDLRIPSDLDPALIALEITRRAARHHLAHARSSEERAHYAALADAAMGAPQATGFTVTHLRPNRTAEGTAR